MKIEKIWKAADIEALIAERDRLSEHLKICNDHLQKMQVTNGSLTGEIDRLKAELALWQGAHGLDRERNLWKSKAETYESKANKLANVLRIIAVYNMEATADEMNYHQRICQEAIAEFEKGV